jgi:phosphatidylserine/phosphatidylglycerophosphate/cardiolipin synthase-like enzyme
MLGAVKAGTKCTVLANYLSDTKLLGALENASRHGVLVDVLLNPDSYGSAAAANALGSAGAHVRMSPNHPYLHAKVLACGELAMAGSANFSYDGMNVNHELDVVLSGSDAASVSALASRLFEEDA